MFVIENEYFFNTICILRITDYFNEEKLIGFYSVEKNSYLKMSIFRTLMEIKDIIIKVINESYQIMILFAYAKI